MNHRRVNAAFNAVITLLGALPIAVIIQKTLMPDAALWSGVVLMLPSLALYPFGFITNVKHTKRLLTVALAVLLSVGFSLIITVPNYTATVQSVVLAIILPVFMLLLFIVPYVYGYRLVRLHIVSIGMVFYILSAAVGVAHAEAYTRITGVAAPLYLITGIFAFNRENLRAVVTPTGSKTRFPAGMRRNNMIILAVFVAFALILANLESFAAFIRMLVLWITGAISFVISSLDALRKLAGGTTTLPDGSGVGLESLLPAGDGGSDFWNRVLDIASSGMTVLIALAVLFFIYKYGRKYLRRFMDWLRALLKRQKPDEEAFIDETENLDRGKLRERSSHRVNNLLGRFRRKPGFDDMETPRAKVRFAYRTALKSLGGSSRTATPNELTCELSELSPASAEQFIAVYNAVRYADGEPSETDVAVARTVNERLKTRPS